MPFEFIRLETTGYIATLTMHRPEKLNALTDDMSFEIHTALDEVDAGWPDVRVLVFTGAGRGFCAGADAARLASNSSPMPLPKAPYGREIIDLGPHLRRIAQPVIAAVNGPATGAGLSLACACDIRIASTEARFGSLFIKRSLVPDTGLGYLLPRIVGPGIASEMALTGRVYDAAWAARVGLVNDVLPPSEVMPAVLAIAEEIAGNPPIAVRSTKKVLDGFGRDLAEVIYTEREFNRQSVGTEDRLESVRSFLEKRKPVYKGR